MINIRAHAEGSVLSVRAQPGARRSALVGEQGEALKIAVTAPADQGRANKALVKILCDQIGLKKAQVELLTGFTSRDKKFLVRGIAAESLAIKLRELLG